MPPFPLTPSEEIKVIGLILDKLKGYEHKHKEVAKTINLNPDYLSKARSEKLIKQNTFGHVTRQQIIDRLCTAYDLQFSRTQSAGLSFLITSDPDPTGVKRFPHCFHACSFTAGGKVTYRGIFHFSKDWKTVKIDYYNQYKKRVKEKTGKVVLTNLHLLITVPSREDPEGAFPTAWYCFPKIDGAWKQSAHFHGLFATFSLNHYPVSGEIVLERYEGSRPEEKIGTAAADHFQILLSDKKLQVDQRIPLSEKEFWSYRLMQQLLPFSGRYMGFYLTAYPRKGWVQCFLQILPNGQALYKCGVFPEITHGSVSRTAPNSLTVVLKMDAHHRIFQNTLTFHLPDTLPGWEKDKTLSGIFSGNNGKHPFACRIRLRAHPPEVPLPEISPEWIPPGGGHNHRELAPFRSFLLGEEEDDYIADVRLYQKG